MNIAWASSDKVAVTVQTDFVHALLSASILVQLTLVILVVMSIFCWAIIFSKRSQLKTLEEANEEFLSKFWKSASLDDVFKDLKNHPESSVGRVFQSGYVELQRLAEVHRKEPSIAPPIDNLERSLRKAIDVELAEIEYRLSFLATTGSSGPFIGLFGTVWGIMNAFGKIGQTGMASLAVVAPGISEALVATAIGLAAAIPASIAYNFFIGQIRKEETSLSGFASDFLNIARRSFLKGG